MYYIHISTAYMWYFMANVPWPMTPLGPINGSGQFPWSIHGPWIARFVHGTKCSARLHPWRYRGVATLEWLGKMVFFRLKHVAKFAVIVTLPWSIESESSFGYTAIYTSTIYYHLHLHHLSNNKVYGLLGQCGPWRADPKVQGRSWHRNPRITNGYSRCQ